MYRPNIDALIKHSISFYWGGDVGEAPEESGIYAWFLPNHGSPSLSLGKLFASVQKQLDQFSTLTEVVGRVGTSRFAVRQSVSAEDWEQRLPVNKWPITCAQVESVGNLLLALSIFSSPIYVGMAAGQGGLRQRLKQHIDGQYQVLDGDPYLGTFAARVTHLMNDPRVLRKCVVACVKVASFPDNDAIIREIEHFLIQTLKPTQSRKG
jgi:hypothetical protein